MPVTMEAAVPLLSSKPGDEMFRDLIARYTGASAAAMSCDVGFSDMGLDSIAAVQLADELLARFNFEINSDEVLDLSLMTLTKHLQEANTPTVGANHTESRPNEACPVDPAVPGPEGNGTQNTHLLQMLSRASTIHAEHIQTDQKLGQLGISPPSLLELKRQLEESYDIRFNKHQPDLTWSVQNLIDFVHSARPGAAVSNGAIQENAALSSSVSGSEHCGQQRLPNPFIALAQANAHFETAAKENGFYGYWKNVAPLQNDLLLAYITEAFDALGVSLSEYPRGIEIPTVQHIPKYDRLMKRLLDILESQYIVVQRAGKILRGSDNIDVDQSSRLCQALCTEHPQYECEAKLMGLVGPRLADCISGNTNPVSVLFGNSRSLDILEDFYTKAPMASTLTSQLLAFLIPSLQSSEHSDEDPIRILEVGAGTGGTTAPLAEALSAARIAVQYTFTDIGPAFVNKAKARFSQQYSWMRFEVLDLERETSAAFNGRFDIVLGANVVHATSNRIAACRRLRKTLRPGGFIVLSEITQVVDWYDICFGLLDGWWLAEGGKGYPIQPADVWMDAFKHAGFSSMSFSTGQSEEANSQQLLVACNRKWDVPTSNEM